MKTLNKTIMTSFMVAMSSTTALADGMTLNDVVNTALDTHPEYQQAQKLVLSAKEGVTLAKSGYMPKVDIALGTGYERKENKSTITSGIASGGSRDTDLNRQEVSLTVNQMLFDGFATPARVEQARSNLDNQMSFAKQVSEKVVSSVAKAFYDVQTEQSNLLVDEENLKMHQDYQGQIRKRVRSGKSNKADLEQVNSRVALAEAQVVTRQELLEQAKSEFFRQVGVEAENLESNDVDYSILPATLDEASEIAKVFNPRIKSLEAVLNASKSSIKEAKAAYMPKVNLELEAIRNQNANGVEKKDHSEQAMFRMRYNLYNGGADKAQHMASLAEADAAVEGLEDVKRSVAKDVRGAWYEYQLTTKRLAALNAQVRAAKATKIAYKSQFDVGQRTLLDVLDSEREYNLARVNLEATKMDRDFSVYQLLALMGKATESFAQEEIILEQEEAITTAQTELVEENIANIEPALAPVEEKAAVETTPVDAEKTAKIDVKKETEEFSDIDALIEESDLFKD